MANTFIEEFLSQMALKVKDRGKGIQSSRIQVIVSSISVMSVSSVSVPSAPIRIKCDSLTSSCSIDQPEVTKGGHDSEQDQVNSVMTVATILATIAAMILATIIVSASASIVALVLLCCQREKKTSGQN